MRKFEMRDDRGNLMSTFETLEDALDAMRKDPRGYEVSADGVVYARSWRQYPRRTAA